MFLRSSEYEFIHQYFSVVKANFLIVQKKTFFFFSVIWENQNIYHIIFGEKIRTRKIRENMSWAWPIGGKIKSIGGL